MSSLGEVLTEIRNYYGTVTRIGVGRPAVSSEIRKSLQNLCNTLQKYRADDHTKQEVCATRCTRLEERYKKQEMWCKTHDFWLYNNRHQTNEQFEAELDAQLECKSCKHEQSQHEAKYALEISACRQTCIQVREQEERVLKTQIRTESQLLAERFISRTERRASYATWLVHLAWECLYILKEGESLLMHVGILERFLLEKRYACHRSRLYGDYVLLQKVYTFN